MMRDKGVIKIIGDSIAAGAGCSLFRETEDVIMEYGDKKYFRCEAANSWWGLLAQEGYAVKNQGCCGAFSYQIREHLDDMISEEDEAVLILLGLNDRKRQTGMRELRENAEHIVQKIRESGKKAILLTPILSTQQNECSSTRIYHTDEVVRILREVAGKTGVTLIDNYHFIEDYLKKNGLRIEDIIFGEGCQNDGLHPADFAQRLMFEHIVRELNLCV